MLRSKFYNYFSNSIFILSFINSGINAVLSHGTHVLSIYAPFWMINKTGKMLTYKGQDPQNVIYHSPDLKQDEVRPFIYAS